MVSTIRCLGQAFLKRRTALASGLLAAVGLTALACSGGETDVVVATCRSAEDTSAPPSDLGFETGAAAGEPRVLVVSSELCIGPNRLVFGLLDAETQQIIVPEVEVSLVLPGDASISGPQPAGKAHFRQWPLGGLGVYTMQVDFDQPGIWGLEVSVPGAENDVAVARANLEVTRTSLTPPLGSAAPPSTNRTSRDVGSLEELTTARPPDPDLYSMTIAEALASDKPTVVVFATPAFCTTATCGPQIEEITSLKDRYSDQANFIHVEIFENLLEIQGDLSRGLVAPAVEEWGLPSEPWTFVVDRQGTVAAKFEAFTTAEEIEEGLQAVLR